MSRSLTLRFVPLFATAVLAAACDNQPEPQDPAIEQVLNELPEIEELDEPAPDANGGVPGPTPSVSGEPKVADDPISGSNEDGARQPDPIRTKLIKADPR